jgi:hypothetical protein
MTSAAFHRSGALTSEACWLEFQPFWQLPLIMTTSWCNVLTDTLWSRAQAARSTEGDRVQLIVPEPLQTAEECGLFA